MPKPDPNSIDPDVFAAVFDALDEGVLVCRHGEGVSNDGIVIAANPAFTTLTGYAGEAIVGWRPSILFGASTDARSRRQLEDAGAAGRATVLSLALHARDGSVFEARTTVRPLPGPDGRPQFWIYRFHDVRLDRERAERARRLQAELTHALQRHGADDAPSRRLLRALGASTGWSRLELWLPRGRAARGVRLRRVETWMPEGTPATRPRSLPSAEGIVGRAWKTRQTAGATPPPVELGPPPPTELALPLVAGQQVIAVVAASVPAGHTAAYVDVVSDALAGLGLAFERTRHDVELRAHAKRERALARSAVRVLETNDLDAFARETIELAVRSIGVPAGFIARRRGERLEIWAACGLDDPGALLGHDSLLESCLASGALGQLHPPPTWAGFAGAVCVPFGRTESADAALVLLTEEPRRFTRPEERFLTTLSQPLWLAEYRRRAEAARARLAEIVASSRDGIVGVAPDGRIESWNDGARELFGYTATTITGRAYTDLVPEANRGHLSGLLARVAAGEHLRDVETVHRHLDGRALDVALTLSPLRSPSGAVVGSAIIARDITQRKRNEAELERHRNHLGQLVQERTRKAADSIERLRASERLAAMGTLAAGLGHDMDNLLFPIRCRLESLASVRTLREMKAGLEGVGQSIEYLQQISNGLRLLALDRENDGSGAVTELAEWWTKVEPMMSKALPSDVVLEARFDDPLPSVRIAPHRLTQAVFNIILNAGEAVDAGGVVRVRASLDASEDTIRLVISDDGAGMPAEIRRQALDPFFTTKKRSLSTGLGLTIVHSVLGPSGGHLEVDSAPGQGTSMVLVLPAHRVEVEADDPSAARIAAITVRDQRTAAVSAAILTSAQFETRTLTDMEEAFDSVIWVMDASRDAERLARRYLETDPQRQVVMLEHDGVAISSPRPAGLFVVERARGLRALRAGLKTAIARRQAEKATGVPTTS